MFVNKRNVANLLQRIKYIEKMGAGINRMQNAMKEAGMRPIKFGFGGFVTAVFELAAEAFDEAGGANGGVNLLEYIKNNMKIVYAYIRIYENNYILHLAMGPYIPLIN